MSRAEFARTGTSHEASARATERPRAPFPEPDPDEGIGRHGTDRSRATSGPRSGTQTGNSRRERMVNPVSALASTKNSALRRPIYDESCRSATEDSPRAFR
jgi:hypothetical protein